MTMATIDAKIRPEHLQRRAFVYIRQSSPQQLRDHVEGRRRQFQMTDWAEHAGWPKERIVVIDEEGKTAAIPKARAAFGDLITAVGRGEAGIVISLEVSRLARKQSRLASPDLSEPLDRHADHGWRNRLRSQAPGGQDGVRNSRAGQRAGVGLFDPAHD